MSLAWACLPIDKYSKRAEELIQNGLSTLMVKLQGEDFFVTALSVLFCIFIE